MRLFRLMIIVFGADNEPKIKNLAFTAKAQALSEFNRQNRMLLENNHEYHLSLAIVETLPNVAEAWIESIESETSAVKLIEIIRVESFAPVRTGEEATA